MSDVAKFTKPPKGDGGTTDKPAQAAESRNDALKARYSKPQDNRHKTPVKSTSKPMKH